MKLKPITTTKRIHYMDSLRSIMMLLGLVLHSALTYNITEHGEGWVIKDPGSTDISTDFIALLIHSFRMPIFFLVAGFFGAMLFYERGISKMSKNRVQRIVYPFIVFLIILTPVNYYSFYLSNLAFLHEKEFVWDSLNVFEHISTYVPYKTEHLWFLYYLILITSSTTLIALILKKLPKFTKKITLTFNWIIQIPIIRIVFFAAITFILLSFLKTPMIDEGNSLIPELKPFASHFLFYLVGWVFYKSKQHLEKLKKYNWTCTILAVLLTITQGIIIEYSGLNLTPDSNSPLLIAISSFTVWLFIFGVTGLFIRYSSNHSKRMRYVSDSSYWVYLIHYPLTAIIPGFLVDVHIPAFLKFLIVLSISTAICFLTYHYFVRDTLIGKFLNGRRYPIKKKLKLILKPA